MQSKKPIYKKPWEKINHYGESTWVGNSTPIFENEGHLLFIPKENNPTTIAEA